SVQEGAIVTTDTGTSMS
nr:immunoglobulin heavy chain junction region [Mus musculus]